MLSLVSAVRDVGRLRDISTVLVRHGFGEIAVRAGIGRGSREEEDHGERERGSCSIHERIRLVLTDLGPSFIKLGQIISTRADLLPPELIAELCKLQDDVPPVPFADIKAVIEGSLGVELSSRFTHFEERPLATASIGQVHRARLASDVGEVEVVVKVQRPGVAEVVARDLNILHMMAAALERAIPETKLYSPVELVRQFDRAITDELSYLVEAEHGERFAKNFAGMPEVRFPRVYREASSRHVLTLEYLQGDKLKAALEKGHSGPLIARRSIGVIIKMIFEDGFFHADPHPGNILILGTSEEPIIGLIDLGMVGRLDPELRDRTIDLMVAAARKDSYAVADALYAIGNPTTKVDMRAYRAEVSALAEKYLGRPMKEIEISHMVGDLAKGAQKYGIEIPPDFLMVGKALMTIEGIGKQLDPDLDVFREAAPHFMRLLRQRYSPSRMGAELWRGLEQLGRAGYDVPLKLREVLEDLRLGRMHVLASDPAMPGALDRLGRRLFSGALSAALLIAGALLHASSAELGGALLGCGALFALVHLILDLRRPASQ